MSCAILRLALHSADTHCMSKMQICLDLVGAYPAPPLGSPDRVAHSQFTMCSKRMFRTRLSPAFSMVRFLDSQTLWWRRGSFVHISMLTQLELCKQLLSGRINHPLAPFRPQISAEIASEGQIYDPCGQLSQLCLRVRG